VREHYLPLGPNSPLPSSDKGKILALFDKMDSFYWLLAAGERPTGSRDPLGLRRLASAIVRLIDARPENDLYFPAAWQRCNDSNPELAKKLHLDHDKIATLATDLLLERAKDFLEERDRVPPGVFLAVLNSDICGSRQQFSRAILTNAQTFARALETKEGQTILALYKRVTNILHIEEKKDKKRHDNAVDESLLKTEPQEAQTLYTEIRKAQNDPYFTRPQFYAYYFMYMADLAPIAANFFDAVFINDPDPARRANRLGLLSLLRTLLESYADFSQIEG
ncbi:MAG: glycine--tRNA ligase subunit beta, partial [Holosporales bacterium]